MNRNTSNQDVPPASEHTPERVAERAIWAANHGFSVVPPPREDGSKAPQSSWGQFTQTAATPSTVEKWYKDGKTGIGVVTGAVSGNLELLEFDDRETWELFQTRATEEGLAPLLDRVKAGYSEETPGDGLHLLYRIACVRGNTKLARRRNDAKTVKTLIETRGEGGYVIVSPTHGRVHPSGRAYRMLAGGLDSIVTLSDEEHEALFALARSFDECRKPTGPKAGRAAETGRPGDDYNERATWPEILNPHGWTDLGEANGVGHWQRPGKRHPGTSATTNYGDADLLFVFTTSSEFDAETAYSKFAAYTLLNHGGDYTAAATALGALGYGSDVASGHSSRFPLTDYGNAERLMDAHGSDMRYNATRGKWHTWDGSRWEVDLTGEAIRRAKETARSIPNEAADIVDPVARRALMVWAKQSETKARLDAMRSLAESEAMAATVEADFDTDPYLFTCANGTIDLRSGELGPHRREDLITMTSPVTYVSGARSSVWDDFLRSLTSGDDELSGFLKRALGYCMTGVTVEEVLFFLHGPEASGKSSFIEAINTAFGDHYRTAEFETFVRKSNPGIRNDLAALVGARLVAANEVDEGKALSPSVVKAATGGDALSVRFLFKEYFSFKPTFKLVLISNHAPLVSAKDGAMWRRMLRLPMEHTLSPEERDKTLKTRLQQDPEVQQAILAWLVEGCLEWQDEGLRVPAIVTAATAEYRQEMNPLARFLAERCTLTPGAAVPSEDFWSLYQCWCEAEGEQPVPRNSIIGYLELVNVEAFKGTGGKRMYRNLTLD